MNYFVASLAFLLGFLLAVKNPNRSLFVSIFLLPWSGISVEIGVSVTPFLAAFAPLAFSTLFLKIGRRHPLHFLGCLFLGWALIITVIHFPLLPTVDVEGGGFRSGVARSVSQIIMLLISMSPVIVVPKLGKSFEHISGIAETFVLSVVLLSSLAWFQAGVYYTLGVDPFPIGMVRTWIGSDVAPHTIYTISAIAEYQDVQIFRPSSLGGEPKDFAMSVLAALMLVQIGILHNQDGRYRNRRLMKIWLFFFLTIALTAASTAYILFVISNMFLLLFYTVYQKKYIRPIGKFLFMQLIAVLLISCAVVLTYLHGAEDTGVLGFLHARTFGRFEDRTGSDPGAQYFHEDHDGPVISFLIDHPEHAIVGVGLGNAHLYSFPYSLLDVVYCHVAKRGYLRVISEIGVVGLVIMLLWFAHYWFLLEHYLPLLVNEDRPPMVRLLLAGFLLLIIYLVGGFMHLRELWFVFFGMMIACAHLAAVMLERRSATIDVIAAHSRSQSSASNQPGDDNGLLHEGAHSCHGG